jgi:hypothetical protein
MEEFLLLTTSRRIGQIVCQFGRFPRAAILATILKTNEPLILSFRIHAQWSLIRNGPLQNLTF